MKRFHVHVSVDDLSQNIRFYSAMFGVAPTVEKSDYAKWMLDDPRINFAISQRGGTAGVNHLGFQVESAEDLEALRAQVAGADIQARDEAGASCCYARSDKYWVQDPQGVAWETFHTLGDIPVFGEHAAPAKPASSGCCVPEAPVDFAPRPKPNACCG
ncbi:MAG: ArsI/CadI family heavy metal resistance metalloenzyme [Nevskia sp.]|nr:ArsI/CadI family heavy metal resistance metalloenzyme [Nevskia sp.]